MPTNPSQPFDERVKSLIWPHPFSTQGKPKQVAVSGGFGAAVFVTSYVMFERLLEQAVAELVEAARPEKKTYTEAKDISDHWGMTDSSIARQINNIKSLGHNEAIDQYHANLLAGLTGGDRKWTRKLEKSTMEEVDTYLAILKAPQRKRQ